MKYFKFYLAACFSSGLVFSVSAQTVLDDYPDLARALEVAPIHAGDESSCIGYRGDDIALYVGPRVDATILGYAKNGDTLTDQYRHFGDWAFTEIYRPGKNNPDVIGWYKSFSDWDKKCTDLAG